MSERDALYVTKKVQLYFAVITTLKIIIALLIFIVKIDFIIYVQLNQDVEFVEYIIMCWALNILDMEFLLKKKKMVKIKITINIVVNNIIINENNI